MIYQLGETAYVSFTTNSSTGAAVNADSLPTASLLRNGAVDGAVTVTVTNLSTGAYVASFAVPGGYSVGDDLELLISATVATIAAKLFIGRGKVDSTIASRAVAGDAMTLADNAITANKLAAGAITAAKIATDAITADKIATDAIGASELSAAAVAKIAAGITTGYIYRLLATPLRSGRSEPVRYVRGSTKPDLLDHILDGQGQRYDLTGYTITASFIQSGTEAAIFEDEPASLGNAPEEGQVVLEWPAAALDTVGSYKLIWMATLSGEELRWITPVVVE